MLITAELAALAMGVQLRWMRRIIRDFQTGRRCSWHGTALDITSDEGRLKIAFNSLPRAGREALLMMEQMPLPFPPPLRHIWRSLFF